MPFNVCPVQPAYAAFVALASLQQGAGGHWQEVKEFYGGCVLSCCLSACLILLQ